MQSKGVRYEPCYLELPQAYMQASIDIIRKVLDGCNGDPLLAWKQIMDANTPVDTRRAEFRRFMEICDEIMGIVPEKPKVITPAEQKIIDAEIEDTEMKEFIVTKEDQHRQLWKEICEMNTHIDQVRRAVDEGRLMRERKKESQRLYFKNTIELEMVSEIVYYLKATGSKVSSYHVPRFMRSEGETKTEQSLWADLKIVKLELESLKTIGQMVHDETYRRHDKRHEIMRQLEVAQERRRQVDEHAREVFEMWREGVQDKNEHHAQQQTEQN